MKITIRKSLFYPCAVLWIVLLSKTYFFGVANRSTFQYAFYLTAILGVFVCRLSKIKIVMILHWLVPMLVFLLLNLILSLDTLQTDGLNAWFGKVIVIICSALLSSALPKKEFARWYIQIISFFAVISLVCVTIANCNTDLAYKFCQVGYNSKTPVGYSMLYTWGWNGTIFKRNSGPFWEAGAYQGFLMLALLMLLYNVDEEQIRHRGKYFILLIITIFTTKSTTAYVLLIILATTHWDKVESIFENLNKNIRRVIVVVFAVGVVWIVLGSNNIADKFSGKTNQSAAIRFADIIGGIRLVFRGGVFGLGNTITMESLKNIYGINVNDSAGMLLMTYTYGVFFGLSYLLAMIWSVRSFFSVAKFESYVVLILVFLVLHLTEDVWALPVYLCILFLGISENNRSPFKEIECG